MAGARTLPHTGRTCRRLKAREELLLLQLMMMTSSLLLPSKMMMVPLPWMMTSQLLLPMRVQQYFPWQQACERGHYSRWALAGGSASEPVTLQAPLLLPPPEVPV